MSSRIKGITLEIGGDTTPLQKALQGLEKETKSLNADLKDVNRLLKLDPGNTELLAQKQAILSKNVETTSNKLKVLSKAQDEANTQFKEGKISEKQFNAIKREVIATESELKKYGKELSSISKSDAELGKLKSELKEINDALKFDKAGGDNYTRKLENLEKQLKLTGDKAKDLEQSMTEAKHAFDSGDMGQDEFEKLAKALEKTKKEYAGIEKAISQTASESKNYERNAENLEKLLQGLGKETEDFADVLGTKLLRGLQSGAVDSKGLKLAFEKIGKEALSSKADIKGLARSLGDIDKGDSAAVSKAIASIGREANEASNDVQDLVQDLRDIKGFEALKEGYGSISSGAGQVKDLGSTLLDESSLRTKIQVTTGLEGEELEKARSALASMNALGIENGEGQEALRRQLKQNKKLTLEQNIEFTKTAAALSSVYDGIDLTELIQENGEISKTLNITTEESLALVSALLDVGFPPEQVDIISEYGTQLTQAGYSAEEIQGIFAAGIDTGTWNIDNLLDGIKEGRIKMTEFGDEISPAMQSLLEKAGIGAERFQQLGKDIAEGGSKGKLAYEEVAQMLQSIDDKTLQNSLGVAVYGTKWEDQGTKIIDTILGIEDHTKTAGSNTQDLAKKTEMITADPAVKFKEALSDLMVAVTPLLDPLAEIVGGLADWIKANPELALGIGGIKVVLGPLVEMASGLGLSLKAIKSGAGALKGLSLAGSGAGALGGAGAGASSASAAGAGAAGIGFGTGLALVGATAFTTFTVSKAVENYGEMEKAKNQFIEALDREEKMEAKLQATREANRLKMKNTYSRMAEETGISFAELYNAINDNTRAASESGEVNAENLSSKSIEQYEKLLEEAGFDFEEIKYDIGNKTALAESLSTTNFSFLQSAASMAMQNLSEDTNTKFELINGKIVASTDGAKTSAVQSFADIKTGTSRSMEGTTTAVKNTTETIRQAFEEGIPAAAGFLKTAFDGIPEQLEKGPFDSIKTKAQSFLRNLASLFENFKPRIKIGDVDVGGYPSQQPGTTILKPFDKGGVFTKPAIIGIAEKRPEFVGALSDLKVLMREVLNEKSTAGVEHFHSGSIRVEGYRDGDLEEVREIILDELRKDSRL